MKENQQISRKDKKKWKGARGNCRKVKAVSRMELPGLCLPQGILRKEVGGISGSSFGWSGWNADELGKHG